MSVELGAQFHGSNWCSALALVSPETTRTPRSGTGKPERLKHLGGEVWSRRITEKDRLVYDIQSDVVNIIACRFHYDDH